MAVVRVKKLKKKTPKKREQLERAGWFSKEEDKHE